jgi:signal transduction histidine kinase
MRLTNINQRAQGLGGKINFRSKQENGVIAVLELPIQLERSLG